MPPKFTFINEERAYWELVMYRLMHFICAGNFPHINIYTNPSILSDKVEVFGSILNGKLILSLRVPQPAFRDQQNRLAELARWRWRLKRRGWSLVMGPGM
jgi:hypothetical protein